MVDLKGFSPLGCVTQTREVSCHSWIKGHHLKFSVDIVNTLVYYDCWPFSVCLSCGSSCALCCFLSPPGIKIEILMLSGLCLKSIHAPIFTLLKSWHYCLQSNFKHFSRLKGLTESRLGLKMTFLAEASTLCLLTVLAKTKLENLPRQLCKLPLLFIIFDKSHIIGKLLNFISSQFYEIVIKHLSWQIGCVWKANCMCQGLLGGYNVHLCALPSSFNAGSCVLPNCNVYSMTASQCKSCPWWLQWLLLFTFFSCAHFSVTLIL